MPQLNFASSTANASLGNVQQPRRRLVRVRARDGLSSGAKCNPVTEGARYSFSPSRLCPLETEQKAGVRNGKPDFSLRNQCCRRGCTSRRNPPGAQMNGETGKAAQGEPGKKVEKRTGEAAQTENGARREERMGQAPQPQKGAGNETQTGPAADHGAAQGQAQSGQNEKPPATGQASTSAPRHGGGNVQAMGGAHISKENASRIADTLMATGSPQNVNINVSVGDLLPGEVDPRPLPPAVVELVPEYRGYDYVVVNEEIFIIQPSTRRVVEIIREGGPTQAMEGPPRINLTEAQQRMLFEAVRREGVPEAPMQAELADGATVPVDVTLEPVPQAVVVQIPMIERYRLFVANDEVVLVDPDTREVVDVVR